MKKIESIKLVTVLSSLLFASVALAQPPAIKPGDANVRDSSGKPVRDGSGQCVRAGFYTPDLDPADCGAGLTARSAPVAQPVAAADVTPKASPVPQRVTFKADSFFEFDKALLNSAGQRALRDLVTNSKGVTLEQILVEGHTDSIGRRDYNQKLSEKRAQAVRGFLVSEGLPANKIRAEGKGELQPVATNTTREGRAQNRRVTIEVIGSKTAN